MLNPAKTESQAGRGQKQLFLGGRIRTKVGTCSYYEIFEKERLSYSLDLGSYYKKAVQGCRKGTGTVLFRYRNLDQSRTTFLL
jgi:hypothetical protein